MGCILSGLGVILAGTCSNKAWTHPCCWATLLSSLNIQRVHIRVGMASAEAFFVQPVGCCTATHTRNPFVLYTMCIHMYTCTMCVYNNVRVCNVHTLCVDMYTMCAPSHLTPARLPLRSSPQEQAEPDSILPQPAPFPVSRTQPQHPGWPFPILLPLATALTQHMPPLHPRRIRPLCLQPLLRFP